MYYLECDGNDCKGKLFKNNKPYKIVTSRPYLVITSEVPDVLAFVDIGFNGTLEKITQKEQFKLPKNYRDRRLVWVGTRALNRFKSMLVDYDNSNLTLFCNSSSAKTLGSSEISFSSTFESWKTMPLFSMDVILNHTKTDKTIDRYKMNAFIDTGNPETFLYEKNFRTGPLKDLRRPDCRDCNNNNKDIRKVKVEDSTLVIVRDKRFSVQVITGKNKFSETSNDIYVVCQKGKGICDSRIIDDPLQKPNICPTVDLNIGNDVLSSLSQLFFNFVDRTYVAVPNKTLSISDNINTKKKNCSETSEYIFYFLIAIVFVIYAKFFIF